MYLDQQLTTKEIMQELRVLLARRIVGVLATRVPLLVTTHDVQVDAKRIVEEVVTKQAEMLERQFDDAVRAGPLFLAALDQFAADQALRRFQSCKGQALEGAVWDHLQERVLRDWIPGLHRASFGRLERSRLGPASLTPDAVARVTGVVSAASPSEAALAALVAQVRERIASLSAEHDRRFKLSLKHSKTGKKRGSRTRAGSTDERRFRDRN